MDGERDPVAVVVETEWTPGTISMSAENLSSPEFDHRTTQPVASRYTDWAIPAYSIFTVLYTYLFIIQRLYQYIRGWLGADEFEEIWKEDVLRRFNISVLFRYFVGGTEDNHEYLMK